MGISEVAAYWDRRPCNIRHSKVDIDKDPILYDLQVAARKYKVEPHITPFLEPWKWRGKLVLELGCGIGTDTVSLAFWGAKVVAMDISRESLNVAIKRALAHKLSITWFPKFVQGNIEYIENHVPIAPYDLVYSFGVIHHTPKPIMALRSAKQYMDENSELRIMLYHRYTTKMLAGMLRHWKPGRSWDDVAGIMSEAQANSPVTYTYSKHSARKLLEEAGYRVTKMQIAHIFPYKIPEYINHEYVKHWYWPLLKLIEPLFGWHILINAKIA
jgi:SAM-dependent methyltransferase